MKIIVGLFLFLACVPCVYADTILFNSGKTIEGKIVEENAESIKVDSSGVTLTYWKDEIKEIIKAKGPETEPVEIKAEKSEEAPITITSNNRSSSKEAIKDYIKQLDEAAQRVESIIGKAKAGIGALIKKKSGDVDEQRISFGQRDIIEKAKSEIAALMKKIGSLYAPRGCGKLKEYSMKIARTVYGEFEANSSGVSNMGELSSFWNDFEKKLMELKTFYQTERTKVLQENKIDQGN